MDVVTILAVIAGAFGVGMGASPLLQAIKAHRRKSSSDVSILFLLILVAGGTAWLSYGIAIKNPALIVGNSVGIFSSLTALLSSLKWRNSN